MSTQNTTIAKTDRDELVDLSIRFGQGCWGVYCRSKVGFVRVFMLPNAEVRRRANELFQLGFSARMIMCPPIGVPALDAVTGKEQWKDWSNRKIAEELKCSYQTVRRYRTENSVDTGVSPEKRRGKDGKMYPVKAKKNQKSATKPDTAPTSPTVATETLQANNESQTPDRATDANTVEISETPIRELRPNRGNSHPEARAERERILEDISALVCRINRWFDSAPEVLHNEFAGVLQKRFQEIIGTEPTPSR